MDDWKDRARINLIGTNLASLRDSAEGLLVIGYAAHGPSADCRDGSISVTVHKDGEVATSEAVALHDALYLARAKVNALLAKREAARLEAAKAKVSS